MIWILMAIAGFFVVKNSNFAAAMNPGANTPVINQATGNSLTRRLGTKAKAPAYYQSGNPGYNAASRADTGAKIVARPVANVPHPTRVFSSVPGKVVPLVHSPGTSIHPRLPAHATSAKPVLSNFVNFRQVNRNTTAPELAQPFWTKTRRSL